MVQYGLKYVSINFIHKLFYFKTMRCYAVNHQSTNQPEVIMNIIRALEILIMLITFAILIHNQVCTEHEAKLQPESAVAYYNLRPLH